MLPLLPTSDACASPSWDVHLEPTRFGPTLLRYANLRIVVGINQTMHGGLTVCAPQVQASDVQSSGHQALADWAQMLRASAHGSQNTLRPDSPIESAPPLPLEAGRWRPAPTSARMQGGSASIRPAGFDPSEEAGVFACPLQQRSRSAQPRCNNPNRRFTYAAETHLTAS